MKKPDRMKRVLAEVGTLAAEIERGSTVEDRVENLEETLGGLLGMPHVIVVSSGTAAIHCALAALDVGPGDEVLVPALSVVMSVMPVLYLGATPVFVDSRRGGVGFDLEDLERKRSARTRVVVPVHLWGASDDMSRLMDFARGSGLHVVEDACQAFGSQRGGRAVGTWGDLGCFSMHRTKLVSTGEGGFIVTRDASLAARCRGLRNHWKKGTPGFEAHSRVAWNYRLSEWQAAVGLASVATAGDALRYRQWQSRTVLDALADVQDLGAYRYDEDELPNFFSPILHLRRGEPRAAATLLSHRGVANSVGTFGLRPTCDWPVFAERYGGIGCAPDVPNTRAFLGSLIAVVLSDNHGREALERIVAATREVARAGDDA